MAGRQPQPSPELTRHLRVLGACSKPTTKLARRSREPTLERPKEIALIGKAQEIGDLSQGEAAVCQIFLGKLATRAVKENVEGCILVAQAPLQGTLADAQRFGQRGASGFAVREHADNLRSHLPLHSGVVQSLQ